MHRVIVRGAWTEKDADDVNRHSKVVQYHERVRIHHAPGRGQGCIRAHHRRSGGWPSSLNEGQKLNFEVAMERGKATATNLKPV